jgi:hypothetical protein
LTGEHPLFKPGHFGSSARYGGSSSKRYLECAVGLFWAATFGDYIFIGLIACTGCIYCAASTNNSSSNCLVESLFGNFSS